MRIEVKVIPNAKREEITFDGKKYRIKVNSPAENGKANEKLKEILAKHFKIKKSSIRILKGEKSREKIIEI